MNMSGIFIRPRQRRGLAYNRNRESNSEPKRQPRRRNGIDEQLNAYNRARRIGFDPSPI